MKTLLLTLSLAVAGVSAANAQVYQPTVVRSSVAGAIAGALIGGHNGDRWAEGALIGAAAGAVIGSVVDASRPVVYSAPPVVYANTVADAPVVAAAPMVGAQPTTQVVYVTQPQPVVTRVVYVNSYPPPVIVSSPVVYVGLGRGDRYYYRGAYDRHHSHRRDRDGCRW